MTSSAPSSRRSRRDNLKLLPPILCALAVLCVGAYVLSSRGSAHTVAIDNPDGSRSRLNIESLNGLELFNPRTGRAETFTLKAEKTLLFFVSGGDCPTCLDERRVWEKLARAADGQRFDVVGILVRTSPGEARTLVKAYNPQFTLLLDSENRIAQRTELPQLTPFKFLVNRRGEILMTDGPNNKFSAQEAFGEKVAAQIGLAQAVR